MQYHFCFNLVLQPNIIFRVTKFCVQFGLNSIQTRLFHIGDMSIIQICKCSQCHNVTKNSYMTDHIKRPGQTGKNRSKHVMLKQKMESYMITIGACAQNKDDNKQSEDTW